MTERSPAPRRRLLGVVAALALIAVAWAVAAGAGGDDESSTTTEGAAPIAAPSATATPETTQPTAASAVQGDVTSTTRAPEAKTTTTTDPPDPDPIVSVPDPSIPDADEETTCRAIVEKLEAYRDIAAGESMENLPVLALNLEELEHDIDFYGQAQDWADYILERLVLVRRDWVTAHSAAESGDQAEAQARYEAAMENLDAAIAVDCPSA